MTAQQLKASILQLAIQGKLVPQNPADEPASMLLKRIKAEKDALVRAKKLKKEKPLPPISEDDIPFEIPDSWEWVRCGDVFQHNTGKALNSIDRNGRLLEYITTSNLYWDRFELGKLRKMYFVDAEIEKCTARKGDLLVCEGGDFGRAAIWNFDHSICIQNHIHRLRSFAPVSTKFFYYLFFFYKSVGLIGGKGIGIQGLSSNALHALVFPFPPLEEQMRIVAKIEELLPRVAEYGKAETELSKLNAELPEQLKKSILQWAIQGRLVPQDPTDEPASDLLKRIKAEKAALIKSGKLKKEKPLPPISEDEIPFDIPESWQWVRLGTISHCIQYGFTASASAIGNARMLRITDIHDNSVSWQEVPFCSVTDEEFQKYQLHNRDILIARTGGTIGKTYIVNALSEKAVFASYLIRIVPAQNLCEKYLKLFMESPLYWSELKRASAGTGQPNVNGQALRSLFLPLPPLAEQNRIVEMIKRLMPNGNLFYTLSLHK